MEQQHGIVQIYSGEGHGKSSAALGKALQVACDGKDAVIITFLKGLKNEEFLKRLEPEIRIFRFEKSEEEFSQLSPERQQEEVSNIKALPISVGDHFDMYHKKKMYNFILQPDPRHAIKWSMYMDKVTKQSRE